MGINRDITDRKRAEQASSARPSGCGAADASRAFAAAGMDYRAVLEAGGPDHHDGAGRGCNIRPISQDQQWLLQLAALYDLNAQQLSS